MSNCRQREVIKRATQLYPPKREPCEAKTSYTSPWKKGVNTRCTSKASYEIGGKKLCGQHAGSEALRVLLEDQK